MVCSSNTEKGRSDLSSPSSPSQATVFVPPTPPQENLIFQQGGPLGLPVPVALSRSANTHTSKCLWYTWLRTQDPPTCTLLSCCLVGNSQAGRSHGPSPSQPKMACTREPTSNESQLQGDGVARRCYPGRLAGGGGSWVVEMRPDVPSSLSSRKGG